MAYANKAQLLTFARTALITNQCPSMSESWTGSTWETNYQKFQVFIATGKPQWTVFTIGNSKLGDAIIGWSTLPEITCPGAGPCLKWCYSFHSWRYPAPFFRQLQNTFLIKWKSPYLTEEFHKLPLNGDLRLYVDGDIDSLETLKYWQSMLKQRLDLRAYGYSKSWEIFQQFTESLETMAPNYQLNLSSGSKYPESMKVEMLKRKEARGEFVAIPGMGKNQHRDMPAGKRSMAWTQWVAQVKDKAKAQGHSKVFVCPGTCQTCTPSGHACGSSKFKGVTVAIGVH